MSRTSHLPIDDVLEGLVSEVDGFGAAVLWVACVVLYSSSEPASDGSR